MAWSDERMTAFDVESTGVVPEEARIVQAHLADVGGGQPTTTWDLLVNPGVPIDPGATEVHGITDEMAKGGEPAPGAIGTLAFTMATHIRARRPIIAFNAKYDLTVLDRECRRHGIVPPPWQDALVVDPFVLDKWLDRFRRGSRKLADVCAHYGVRLDAAHDAGEDALATARLAWAIMHKTDAVQGRHPEIIGRRASWKQLRDDVDALQVFQRIAAAEQARGLRDYFERQGKHEEAASVREEWPWIPMEVATC